MRGRRPTLKAVDGGLNRVPPMPSHLPESCVDDWRTTTADLQGRGLLLPAVLPIVGEYVGALAISRECRAAIFKDGPIVRTAQGNPKPHPAAAMLKAQGELVARLAAELGLTALGRSRAGIRDQERKADAAADPFAEFGL